MMTDEHMSRRGAHAGPSKKRKSMQKKRDSCVRTPIWTDKKGKREGTGGPIDLTG